MKTTSLILGSLLALSAGRVQAQGSDCPTIPAEADFGLCQMFLGIANIEGFGCVALSGCGYTWNNTDYSSYFFQELAVCEAQCAETQCDQIPSNVDFGDCDMALGTAYIEGQGCVSISGCGYTASDGIDYTDYFFTEMEECETQCNGESECNPIPSGIDFGPCAMVLGVAPDESGNCVTYSGCGYTGSDGVDYSSYFYSSDQECEAACGSSCIDPALMDPNVLCPGIWAPVCGCDNITYSNDCEATYFGGVTSFTQGECLTGVSEIQTSVIRTYPNPASHLIRVDVPSGLHLTRYEITGTDGRTVKAGNFQQNLDISSLPAGIYFLRAKASNSRMTFEARFSKN